MEQMPQQTPSWSEEQQRSYETLKKGAVQELVKIFDRFSDVDERSGHFREKLSRFQGMGDGCDEAIRQTTDASRLTEKGAFLSATSQAMDPLIRFYVDHADIFEKRRIWEQAERNRQEIDYTLFTDLIGYEMDPDGWLRLHVPDNREKEPAELFALLQKSFQSIADHLEAHSEIPGIRGSSWILGNRSGERLAKRIGFLVSSMSEEDRLTHFADEKRPVKQAEISREEFLRRYGGASKNAP